jgi:hypothetical protein
MLTPTVIEIRRGCPRGAPVTAAPPTAGPRG